MADDFNFEPLELDYSAFVEPDSAPVSAKIPVAAGGGLGTMANTPLGGDALTAPAKKRVNPLARIQYNAPVTLTFALLALAVLGLSLLTHGNSNFWFSISRGSWTNPAMYLRLFTHVLGHADWQHYLGNFMMILLLGPILEEKYGSARLAIMIAITALITGLMNILLTQYGLLGASGVVFMMILLASITNMEEGRIPLTLILILVLYIGQEVFSWITTDTNISHLAHIVGGLCGAALGLMWGTRKPRSDGAPPGVHGGHKAKMSKEDKKTAKQLAKGRAL